MKKLLRYLVQFVIVSLVVFVIYFNYSLYFAPSFDTTSKSTVSYNIDVYNQLNFLKTKLRQGAGYEMQGIYPEGFIFINALYALSWSNLIEDHPVETQLYKEGIDEMNWTQKEMSSKESKLIFNPSLKLKYGAFYVGWTNYVLGKKLMLQTKENRNAEDIKLFRKNCKDISWALKNNPSPYLESYDFQTWPADGIIAISSLNLYSHIIDDTYQYQIDSNILQIKNLLSNENPLIPHSVDFVNGRSYEDARGSSQSLILNFLLEIDEGFAKEQFEIYKENFLDTRFGLYGIREYPTGKNGGSNIDSGPVILDIGGAASIVGQRTMYLYENKHIFESLRNSIDFFGLARTSNSNKSYLFGKIPMADAFICWSNSIETKSINDSIETNWRWKFQLISIISIIFLLFIYFMINTLKKA